MASSRWFCAIARREEVSIVGLKGSVGSVRLGLGLGLPLALGRTSHGVDELKRHFVAVQQHVVNEAVDSWRLCLSRCLCQAGGEYFEHLI